MKFDLTITVMAIISICSIIAPIGTTWIGSKYQYKIKKLEFKHKEFVEIFKEFTNNYNLLTEEKHYMNASKFQKSSMQLAVICNEMKTRNELLKLGNLVMDCKCRNEETDKLYEHCVKLMFGELKQR